MVTMNRMAYRQWDSTLTPEPCPFCGGTPRVGPAKPELEGDCFGYVRCENLHCPAQPVVKDGSLLSDMRGPGAYKDRAISRWNRRALVGKGAS